MDKKDQQVFPCTYEGENGLTSSGGLTMRDHFAGMAMIGMLVSMGINTIDNIGYEDISLKSVKMADALLEQLEEKKETGENPWKN